MEMQILYSAPCYSISSIATSVNNDYLYCRSDEEEEEVNSHGAEKRCESDEEEKQQGGEEEEIGIKSEEKKNRISGGEEDFDIKFEEKEKEKEKDSCGSSTSSANKYEQEEINLKSDEDKEEEKKRESDDEEMKKSEEEEEKRKSEEEEEEKKQKSDETKGKKKRKSEEEDESKVKKKKKEKRRKALNWVEGLDHTPSLVSSSSHKKPKTKKKNKATIERALARAREADFQRALDNERKKQSQYIALRKWVFTTTKRENIRAETVDNDLWCLMCGAMVARQVTDAVQLFSTGNNHLGKSVLDSARLYNADDCTAYLYPPSPPCSSQSSCSQS